VSIKIALCFRYAQTLLNLAFARFGGNFLVHDFVKLKRAKAKSTARAKARWIRFAHKAFARFARSRSQF